MQFFVAGPSGVGKSYLIEQLLQKFPGQFVSPQLITTRPARPGNTEVDRQSVSLEEFKKMEAAGDFLVTGEFRGNWYGFPVAITEPRAEHVMVNIWPALVPRFANLPGSKLIGLTVSDNNLDLLQERMLQRGDSQDVVNERMEQVKVDLADLRSHYDEIVAKGSMFEVTGDDTIPEQVLPWVMQTLL